MKDFLERLGFLESEINFSGFYSQGDGASWHSPSALDLDDWIELHEKWDEIVREALWVPRENANNCTTCLGVKWAHQTCPSCRGLPPIVQLPELPKYAKWFAKSNIDWWCRVERRECSRGVHEMTCFVNSDWDLPEGIKELPSGPHGLPEWAPKSKKAYDILTQFDDDIEDWRKGVCYAIYRDLEREYEYFTGEEALAEAFATNEYHFFEDGRIA